jgi:hypothetical protein
VDEVTRRCHSERLSETARNTIMPTILVSVKQAYLTIPNLILTRRLAADVSCFDIE